MEEEKGPKSIVEKNWFLLLALEDETFVESGTNEAQDMYRVLHNNLDLSLIALQYVEYAVVLDQIVSGTKITPYLEKYLNNNKGGIGA